MARWALLCSRKSYTERSRHADALPVLYQSPRAFNPYNPSPRATRMSQSGRTGLGTADQTFHLLQAGGGGGGGSSLRSAQGGDPDDSGSSDFGPRLSGVATPAYAPSPAPGSFHTGPREADALQPDPALQPPSGIASSSSQVALEERLAARVQRMLQMHLEATRVVVRQVVQQELASRARPTRQDL